MMSPVRGLVLRLLRVPPVPRADGPDVRVFRASRNFYRYNLVRWAIAQGGVLVGLLIWLLVIRYAPGVIGGHGIFAYVQVIELFAFAAWLVQLPFTYALLRLDYEFRWYIVSGRSLRVREGLATVREQTMTFANIQNMGIRQGPLQRLLGIADLEVVSAGGGGGESEGKGSRSSGKMHLARFRGVDDATAIRDLIRERVRQHRDAGLGDPDDLAVPAHSGAGPAPAMAEQSAAAGRDPVGAARELLDEVRWLRAALSGGG